MERLTERNRYKAAYYPYCFKEYTCDGKGASKKCDSCEFTTMVCERLAAYEDTGLTPEQILAMDEEYTKLAKELGEYKQKLENVERYLDGCKL